MKLSVAQTLEEEKGRLKGEGDRELQQIKEQLEVERKEVGIHKNTQQKQQQKQGSKIKQEMTGFFCVFFCLIKFQT